MSTYEAARDLVRAQNLPWYKDYLHPAVEEYYKPSMTRHGTFWIGWTATQEARWRRNYRVWMDALREFGLKGGTITIGDDAGYLYGSLYGFGTIRELELHEEAGFHPLEVLRHANADGAKVLGLQDRVGRLRVPGLPSALVLLLKPIEHGRDVREQEVVRGHQAEPRARVALGKQVFLRVVQIVAPFAP